MWSCLRDMGFSNIFPAMFFEDSCVGDGKGSQDSFAFWGPRVLSPPSY